MITYTTSPQETRVFETDGTYIGIYETLKENVESTDKVQLSLGDTGKVLQVVTREVKENRAFRIQLVAGIWDSKEIADEFAECRPTESLDIFKMHEHYTKILTYTVNNGYTFEHVIGLVADFTLFEIEE